MERKWSESDRSWVIPDNAFGNASGGENTCHYEFRRAEDLRGPGRVKVAAGMRERQSCSSGEYAGEGPTEKYWEGSAYVVARYPSVATFSR